MKKELFVLTIIFLIFGMLMNFPLISADNESSGQGQDNNSDLISANNNSSLISANNNSNNGNETGNEDETGNDKKICCHIYGLGSMMKKVNSKYELMESEECAVSKDFVGGGREIVSKKRCEKGYTEKIQAAIKIKNRLRLNQTEIPENCTKTGSILRCKLQNGKAMIVMAGNSGNTIIKIDGENISTKAQLYHHNGEIYGVFKNETKLIEYLPEQLREKIRERIQARIIENGTIELNEKGEYEVEVKKRSRFLGIFKIKEKVRFRIDPETGEILNEHAPWWSFLTSDVKEE